MRRKLRLASVQMDATPVPTASRLERATDLIAEAASAGADVIVLPEMFNLGYEYHDRNFTLAEPIDGPTALWLREQASVHRTHIAGTLLLRDDEDIYNAALLAAPDGRIWRYDKQYPWLWEHSYFREGNRITVADTDLGRIGMMICWDSAHADVWQRYAGRVDAMLILSCPPKMSSADLIFPDGTRINTREFGPLWESIYTDEEYFPGPDMDAYAAWMGIPVVHATGSGTVRTRLPRPYVSLASYLAMRPDLWGRVWQAPAVVLETGFDRQTKIIGPDGMVRARVTNDGDGFTIAEVELPDEPPRPAGPRPQMRTLPIVYLLSDIFGPAFVIGLYRRGVRRVWGEHMAPYSAQTRLWMALLICAALVGWILGRARR